MTPILRSERSVRWVPSPDNSDQLSSISVSMFSMVDHILLLSGIGLLSRVTAQSAPRVGSNLLYIFNC